jgi:hypothetical protein
VALPFPSESKMCDLMFSIFVLEKYNKPFMNARTLTLHVHTVNIFDILSNLSEKTRGLDTINPWIA